MQFSTLMEPESCVPVSVYMYSDTFYIESCGTKQLYNLLFSFITAPHSSVSASEAVFSVGLLASVGLLLFLVSYKASSFPAFLVLVVIVPIGAVC